MKHLFCVLLAFAASLAFAQDSLTNESILKLVKSGLSEDLVVSMVKNQPGKYSLGADDIVALKGGGVSDKVLAAMIEKKPAGAAATAAAPADAGKFAEIGVYVKKGGDWTELLPEIVNWKTGGTMKSIATVGVVKKDMNGNIPGLHSRNSMSAPLEFTISMPEGVAITEYQLLRLRTNKDYREFRTVTGGVFNQRGGAMRDMVPFEGKKISSRVYSVVLPNNLGAGEYGFIHLGASGGSGGVTSLSMGKMYTFRLME